MTVFIVALLLIISWVIAEHFPPWVSWHNEIFAFAAVLCLSAVGLYRRSTKKKWDLEIPTVAFGLPLLLLAICIQFALGYFDFLGQPLVIAFYLFLGFLALTCGFQAASDARSQQRNAIDNFAIALVIGSVLSATIALVQVLDLWEGTSLISRMGSGRRPGANINQPNQLATLLLMGLASLVYLFEAKRVQLAAAVAIYLLLILGLSVTESRTALLSFLALVAWWWALHGTYGSRMTLGAVFFGTAVFTLLFFFWPQLYTLIQAGGLPGAIDTRAGTRLMVWPQLIDATLQRPWFGWGLGGVSRAQNAVIDAYPRGEPFTYAHNVVLDLAVGIGVPITVFIVGIACWWLWRRVRATTELVPWYCLAVTLPFSVHSMLEFPFAYSYLLAPALFAIGFLEKSLAPKRYVTVAWLPAAAIFTSFVFLMGLSVKEYLDAEQDFRVARFEVLGIGVTPSTYVRPKIHLLTQLEALASSTRIRPGQGLSTAQIDLMRQVAIHFPSIATQKRYAFCLALNGNPDEALRQFKVMRAMYGEKYYARIKSNWEDEAREKYPQLSLLKLP